MARRPRPRAPFVVSIVALAAAGCGGSTTRDGAGGSGGAITNPPIPTPSCPAALPSEGTACPTVGLECPFPGAPDPCGTPITNIAQCQADHVWSITQSPVATGCNPPPPPVDPCPSTEPALGQWCNVVETKLCSYPAQCCFVAYQCQASQWVDASPICNPPAPTCPDSPPVDGAACNPCNVGFPTCSYGDCAEGGTLTTATCDGGAWVVQVQACGVDGGV